METKNEVVIHTDEIPEEYASLLKSRGGRMSEYKFNDMQPGGWVLYPIREGESPKKALKRIQSAIGQHRRKHKGLIFTPRITEDNHIFVVCKKEEE